MVALMGSKAIVSEFDKSNGLPMLRLLSTDVIWDSVDYEFICFYFFIWSFWKRYCVY